MYITIDSIIKEMLLEESNPDSWYALYLSHALNAVRELTYDILATLKTEMLTIQPNGTVNFPIDYVNYTKIGIVNNNGNIDVLAINNKICLVPKEDDCGDEVKRDIQGDTRKIDGVSTNELGYYFYNYYHAGSIIGSLFGRGGGYNRKGHYRIDEQNRQIVLSSEIKVTQIVMEYIDNGVSSRGMTCVHEFAKQPVKNWIRWQRDVSRDEPLSKQEMRKRDYEESFDLLSKRRLSFTLEEFKQAWRESFSQSFKN